MDPVRIERLSDEAIASQGIRTWPVWTKEASLFPWHYDEQEQCLILEGDIMVRAEGKEYSIKAGDFVTFKAGLDCTWEVLAPVRKHYRFG
jgi:uncharacterized protein